MNALKLATATLCLAACTAFAPVQTHSVSVAYSDLNLPRDQDRLSVRMLVAMHTICGYRPNPKFIAQNEQFDSCKASLTLAPHKADPAVMNKAFASALAALH